MTRPILANVSRDEFVGRDTELRDLVERSSRGVDSRGLVIQAAPSAGGSELLRQAYDQLFERRGEAAPIHFAFKRSDAMDTARRFLRTFIQQYVAYRRAEPSLCDSPLTKHDLMELALPSDYELISGLLE